MKRRARNIVFFDIFLCFSFPCIDFERKNLNLWQTRLLLSQILQQNEPTRIQLEKVKAEESSFRMYLIF